MGGNVAYGVRRGVRRWQASINHEYVTSEVQSEGLGDTYGRKCRLSGPKWSAAVAGVNNV